jgi:hypothetical protein
VSGWRRIVRVQRISLRIVSLKFNAAELQSNSALPNFGPTDAALKGGAALLFRMNCV